MKAADGRFIVKTDSQEAASHVLKNWAKHIFGNSSCRETVKTKKFRPSFQKNSTPTIDGKYRK